MSAQILISLSKQERIELEKVVSSRMTPVRLRVRAKALDIHIIVDNYATHKHKNVKKWLKRNKRVRLHFIPSSSSWLNLVERFFGLLTDRALRRGVFTSVKELETKTKNFINHNDKSKPLVWTKSANKILEKADRARQSLSLVSAV